MTFFLQLCTSDVSRNVPIFLSLILSFLIIEKKLQDDCLALQAVSNLFQENLRRFFEEIAMSLLAARVF